MAEDLSSGGAVGAVMGEMAKQVLETIKKGEEFRPTLERNIETLNSLAPLVEEMKKYNEVLDRPKEEIERLQTHITEGKDLVKESNNLSRSSEEEYQSKLQEKDVQAESRGDLMEVLSHKRQNLEILLSKENQISGLNTGDLMEGLSHERQILEMGETAKQALQTVKKGIEFRPTLERNTETLMVEDMTKHNEVLDRPIEEIESLQSHITDGKELVKKSNNLSRSSEEEYQSKLQEKDVQAENRGDLMEVEPMDEPLNKLKIELPEEPECMGMDEPLNKLRIELPEEPECMVMDEPLNKLKIELLKDGVSVLVVTGLAGSGKSTLAKKICWEPQIKGKFGGNIFFVTVSKTPNLKNIVQTLFEHCECQVPEFQSDEDPTYRFGVFLRDVVKSPILLVLDDVWPNSEGLVEKFRFQMSDYKILVTSRVAFPRFGTLCQLDPLGHDYAVSLFCHLAQLNASDSYMPDENLVHEIVRGCKGSPLALEVIARSLCKQPFEVWHTMKERLQSQSILESNSTLLHLLQQSLDILDDKLSINEEECFMDLGLFPKEKMIPVAVLLDMWAELHNLDEVGINAMAIIHDLTTRNLINVTDTSKVATETDMYYNNHYATLHDLLRELAIHQSKGKPFEQRERLIIDLNGDDRPDWWVGENQQGIIGYMFSFIPRMLVKQKQLRVAARILSISTDETFTSDWCDMEPGEAEVLVLNLRSSEYTLPEFTKKMSKLKVLTVTNYGDHRSELTKFELLGFLSNLKRIRLEKVSVPCLCILKNLQKLSLHMCTTRQAFEDCSIQISEAMPILEEMSIDYCNDLVKLPEGICNITPLKKLSITNCHKLHALPQDIAKLENLEVLRLCSCSDLEDMPTFVGGLNKLQCLDISDCVSLRKLPDDIGDLQKLEELFMKGCSSLSNLPYSVINFAHLEHEMHVICDEERAALWEEFLSIPNLKIKMPREKGSVLLGCREETAKQALQTVKKGQEFRSTLERNTETLNSCAPVVEEMTKHNEMLDRPREEIERLQSHITEGKELVKKSNNLSRSSEEEYQSKLQKKDVQAESRGDLMEVLSHKRQNLEILLSKENQISGLNTGDLMEGLSHERQILEMGETAKQALQTVKKGIEFRPTLERNTETLMVEDMTKHNEVLDRPREEIERLQSHITDGKELVNKSNNLSRSSEEEYQSKLQEKDMQAESRGDLMEVLSHKRQNLEILRERKRDLLSDSASSVSHDHDHDTEIETMASAMVEVDEVDEESNIHNISPNVSFTRTFCSWQKGEILGKGSFGTVYEGFTDDGKCFAVKEVSLLDDGKQSIFQLQQEISLLSQFQHPNLVQYYGTDKDDDKLYIFLELVTKGSLASLYKKHRLRDSQVSECTRQILSGLAYLHDRNVVHRDIKCANILVDADGSVKLADFGLAKATKLNVVKSSHGLPYWMAPEVVKLGNGGYGLAADIWSLGCTVLEMLTQQLPYSHLERPPYSHLGKMQAILRIGKGQAPPVPESLSKDARDFILRCLQVNPNNRPTAAQLLDHPFLIKTNRPVLSELGFGPMVGPIEPESNHQRRFRRDGRH